VPLERAHPVAGRSVAQHGLPILGGRGEEDAVGSDGAASGSGNTGGGVVGAGAAGAFCLYLDVTQLKGCYAAQAGHKQATLVQAHLNCSSTMGRVCPWHTSGVCIARFAAMTKTKRGRSACGGCRRA
jgi:hypothetical protein